MELIRDSGSKAHGTEQGRWQAELSQTAMELIGVSEHLHRLLQVKLYLCLESVGLTKTHSRNLLCLRFLLAPI